MGLGGQQALGTPSATKDLIDESKRAKLGNVFLNVWSLEWTVGKISACDRSVVASVDFALIVVNRNCHASVVEDAPELFDQFNECKFLIFDCRADDQS